MPRTGPGGIRKGPGQRWATPGEATLIMLDSMQILLLYQCSCPRLLQMIDAVEYQVRYQRLGPLDKPELFASEGLLTEALLVIMQ